MSILNPGRRLSRKTQERSREKGGAVIASRAAIFDGKVGPLHDAGMTQRAIAAILGVGRAKVSLSIRRIRNRREALGMGGSHTETTNTGADT